MKTIGTMHPMIEHNFKYHPPSGEAVDHHSAIRAKAKELAILIEETLPAAAGREKACALTKVEEAMMWACAGIARHSADGRSGARVCDPQQATLVNREVIGPLATDARTLCYAIEKLPASEQQTAISVQASDLSRLLNELAGNQR